MSWAPRRVSGPGLWVASSLLLIALAGSRLWRMDQGGSARGAAPSILVHCAKGLRPALEELAQEFERRTGTRVELAYGGSGTLLAQLQVLALGELYIAGDESYVSGTGAERPSARELELVDQVFSLARMKPVIAVPRGNPEGVSALADLVRADLDVGLALPEAAAVGRVARDALEESGLWEALHARAAVEEPTVTELANALALGTIDAAILWDATVAQWDGLQAIHVPELDARVRDVTLGVLRASERPRDALRFARFLASSDLGAPTWERHGYESVAGDPWKLVPRVQLFYGAMLDAAIDERIRAFEQREGCLVDTVKNGCGILVSQMRAGAAPDAYFSCDTSFLDVVAERFLAPTDVSANAIVLLVERGNPHGLAELGDLARPELRVGLAHPEKSALGELTRRLMIEQGVHEAFVASGNWLVESATGHELVNQLSARSLDAVVVYRSNAAGVIDELEVLPIEGRGALAVQPYAVARQSAYPALMGRLLDFLTQEPAAERFLELGFEWRLPR